MSIWTEAERRAWAWPERALPSTWIEQNLIIPNNSLNVEPGPYSFARTPYWREVADLAIDPVVREIWIYKANQVGYTQLMTGLCGFFAAQDPGALGLLQPDEDSVDEYFAEQLKPTIDATPALRRLKSGRAWDSTKHELWLSSMPILGLYAGSDSKLEKRSLRYVIGDEINLYRPSANEASPIQRLLKRTTNWEHRAKCFLGSKPTNAEGNITRGYESCPDKRRYLMPCWHCGKYQDWIWSGVKGFMDAPGADKFERANWVKLNNPAFYECENCRRAINEKMRTAAIAAGKWVSGTVDGNVWKPIQTVSESGVISGERPISERVGVYVWGIVSAWLTMSQLAAEFIEAEGDRDKTQSHRNARLALPFDEVSRQTRPSIVRDKKKFAPPAGIVPKWAVAIYATFDTQKDWFAGVIRAWGFGFRSQLLWHGQAYSFDEVKRLALESRFAIGDENGPLAGPKILLIDSGGDRTKEVYQFAQSDSRIIATRGDNKIERTKFWIDSAPRPGMLLRTVNVHQFKHVLWTYIHDPDPTRWMPHSDVSEQYCLEMASEQLVKIKGKWIWLHTGTARNEAWDCEVLQCAAAEMDNVGIQSPPAATPDAASSTPSIAPADWMARRR